MTTHRDNIKLTYDRYNYRFQKIVKGLNLNTTEYYYTERNIEWLRQDIEKIPYIEKIP